MLQAALQDSLRWSRSEAQKPDVAALTTLAPHQHPSLKALSPSLCAWLSPVAAWFSKFQSTMSLSVLSSEHSAQVRLDSRSEGETSVRPCLSAQVYSQTLTTASLSVQVYRYSYSCTRCTRSVRIRGAAMLTRAASNLKNPENDLLLCTQR